MTRRLYQPSVLREILSQYDMDLKKSLGQNFLIDGNILKNIRELSGVQKGDVLLEIGPGIGTLSEELLQHIRFLYMVEIDGRAVEILEETLKDYPNKKIIHQDILKVDFSKFLEEGQKIKVVANLPYYITTPILAKLLPKKEYFESITVMVQKEVAERMVAKKDSKTYGSLSVFIQYYADAEILMEVPPTAFMPNPKVDSAVIKLDLKETREDIDEELFFKILHSGFQQRRKTILNSLTSGESPLNKKILRNILEELDLDPKLRVENLSLEDFKEITKLAEERLV